MTQQTAIFMKSWVMIGGFFAIVIVVALVAAMFHGRAWAVLAGVVGTILLLGGGLLLAGVLIFFWRSAPVVETAAYDLKVVREDIRPASPKLAEAPELFPDNVTRPDEVGDKKIVKEAEQPERPSGPLRPAWMDARQGLVDGVYRTTVKVGPFFSRTECEQQLPQALRGAVSTYADHYLGEGKGRYVNLDMAYIHNHLIRNEWEERRETTFDTMITLHELLEFDNEARQAIEANYKQAVVAGRLGYTAAGGGVVLGLLTILFGYFKLDTLTRGYYTGRLRLTAATAILALAAIAGLLVLA